MEEPPLREEEEEEGDEAGPEGALGKSPFQLTAEDVYDISYVMGRELMALGSDPRVTQLQFKIVRVLEMLETLVNEGSLTVEELRMERDNLRKELEGLRRESSAAGRELQAQGYGGSPIMDHEQCGLHGGRVISCLGHSGQARQPADELARSLKNRGGAKGRENEYLVSLDSL
ncbi:RILP-like protein 2 isoform X2 [Lagenorhynchus albirostris]|uniref:RILP-like protein 2 isoform X2 n=1 Tax=Lagenorhynchus albirostris TaxID=27610 RepID=UPI0028E7DD11|nr:RILP-like protein 2 isoform X2 [Lagenorhynchus albirostris]